MTILESLTAFVFAAGLLTLTPGVDTALVLRSSTFDGPIGGVRATAGILIGCLIWGALVAFGLAALITASPIAYNVLKWAGAAYLLWLGGRMVLRPRSSPPLATSEGGDGADVPLTFRGRPPDKRCREQVPFGRRGQIKWTTDRGAAHRVKAFDFPIRRLDRDDSFVWIDRGVGYRTIISE